MIRRSTRIKSKLSQQQQPSKVQGGNDAGCECEIDEGIARKRKVSLPAEVWSNIFSKIVSSFEIQTKSYPWSAMENKTPDFKRGMNSLASLALLSRDAYAAVAVHPFWKQLVLEKFKVSDEMLQKLRKKMPMRQRKLLSRQSAWKFDAKQLMERSCRDCLTNFSRVTSLVRIHPTDTTESLVCEICFGKAWRLFLTDPSFDRSSSECVDKQTVQCCYKIPVRLIHRVPHDVTHHSYGSGYRTRHYSQHHVCKLPPSYSTLFISPRLTFSQYKVCDLKRMEAFLGKDKDETVVPQGKDGGMDEEGGSDDEYVDA